ncbi:MAG TPA: class II aldolase/adducin family protein, partial [Anaerolineaceae bacterium]|nr:class II aldolase/adducin family protein [Anaerolineaceae bacterium]
DFNDAKIQVMQAAQHLTQKGFLSATGGNLSVRITGQNAFAITPSNYDYMKMLPDDICILGMDLVVLEGSRTPSVESAMHAAIYLNRPDTTAVIHTHQVYPSTLAIIGAPIPALFDEQVRFLGRSVEIIPYAPSGTGMLKNTVARHVRNHHNAFMMANHGALVLGHDLERAMHNVEVLEKCALAYLLALCSEKKVSKIPLLVREVAFSKLRKDQKKAAQEN